METTNQTIAILDSTTKTQENKHETTPDYTILHAQQIGKNYRFEIKYNNGKTAWISDHQIISKLKDNYFNKLNMSTRARTQKISPAYFSSIILIIFYFICAVTGTHIKDKFIHCQSRGPNRIINPTPDCKHPIEIKKALAKHSTKMKSCT